MPAPPARAMADTYAAVQKRGVPSAGADGAPLYSQVTPRGRRPQAPADDARRSQAPADDARRTPPGFVPVDQRPAGPGAYEDVVDGAQSSGLGFNLRIGRPKGPRDPPAEWTRV